MKEEIIVGSGINGLVAANYLVKHGFNVSVIEKKPTTGGACVKDSTIIENKNIDFAHGPTVLGMMPDFIFKETGLVKMVEGFYPKTPKLVYFQGEKNTTKIFQDSHQLEEELKNKWGETGKINDFRADENKVIKFIQKLYREANSPSIDLAIKNLGEDLTKLWISGSAKDLLDHYFTSDKTKLYMGMTVIESGPASIYDPGTAFTIPLMDSGSVYNGYWGFVKTGIWKITECLTKINSNLGVKLHLNSLINEVDSQSNSISFSKESKDYKIKYDHLIFANHSSEAIKILKKPSKDQIKLMRSVKYQKNNVIIHSDEKLMPNEKGNWCSWNYLYHNNNIVLTYWMNLLQNLKCKTNIFVTLNNTKIRKEKLIKKITYSHPLFTKSLKEVNILLEKAQGINNIWFAGAWLGYGFHEDGVKSAKKIRNMINV